MTVIIIAIVIGVWILISAILLLSLCIMSSRFNQADPAFQESWEGYTQDEDEAENEVQGNRVPKTTTV